MAIVETTRLDGIAEVKMNRPDSFNALSVEMLQALIETFEQLTNDDSVRCIVLKGAGPAFMAGGDLKMFGENLDLSPTDRAEKFVKNLKALEPLVKAISSTRQPVIAAIQGAAAGYGVSLAAACDLTLPRRSYLVTLGIVGNRIVLSCSFDLFDLGLSS